MNLDFLFSCTYFWKLTKKVSDEMYISPRYLANIENNGQHPSLQIFFELMLRYNISVDQFLLETPPEKNTQRRQLTQAERRIEELDRLFKRIYEGNANGKLSDRRFQMLSDDYE